MCRINYMRNNLNIIPFPNRIRERKEEKEKKYSLIRDKIETQLAIFSKYYGDEWAVALAAGRFASMKLQQMDGSKNTIDFFKKCVKTQEIKKN